MGFYVDKYGETRYRFPDENPYLQKQIQSDQDLQNIRDNIECDAVILKERIWSSVFSVLKIKEEMESFLRMYLIEIQEIAQKIGETLHFSKSLKNRPPILRHLVHLQPKYSIRVTEEGHVWILISKKYSGKNNSPSLAYSPTMNYSGIKQSCSKKEMLNNLSTNKFPGFCVQIWNVSKIYGKVYGKSLELSGQKYSMILESLPITLERGQKAFIDSLINDQKPSFSFVDKVNKVKNLEK